LPEVNSFYLTTPIYYVNSTPHIGHAYTTIAADILVRHHRQRGDDTFFLTGTDEHGSKVFRAAEARGLEAKAFVDQIVEENWRQLPERVAAVPDFFIRTTDDEHKAFVQEFVERLRANGHIYEGTYAGLYCVGHETFISESDLVDGKCPDHGTVPEWIEEQNWFFRLSSFQEPLLRLYDERPDFVLPAFRRNEARSLIEGGLEDFSLSRQGQPWGIPIPWDPEQVTWVWVDALINYVSALTYARPGTDLREVYWPHVRHLIAKDILRLHCVLWPALLLGAGYSVPQQIFVHGYLLLDNRKISKTLGNVIDPLDLVSIYGPDPVRFWAARAVSFGQDGTVSVDSLHERYERELGNDLGNLLSRTTAMIARYRDGRVPEAESAFDEAAYEQLRSTVVERLDVFDITGALDGIWDFVRSLNKFVTDAKPWELAKDEANAAGLDRVLYTLADGLRVAAIALSPYLPETAPRILDAIGQPPELSWGEVARGRAIAAVEVEAAPPLFPRVEAPATAA
jgi:methionyl-tRNA synthetase